ncbi:unnamed protein product [Rotaria sordida]|uniref:RING-type domain-containing protein n=1 Tax=Rotaria sordida TaxID=392033 RepID=A0A819GE34_9BILA|nr:unnamed protein product [Rotaria sordida]CAF1505610.1 unnamed protein product [Rotaria sordida]CAF3880484.1 unnamed protein product [Rotaria sordida]CAF3924359.1 unnamed protein product [Rotaria sordida]
MELSSVQSNKKSLVVTQQLINQQSNDQPDRSCPICFELFNNECCRETFTSCGHSFCEICLQKTLQIKPFCPICRQYQSQEKDNDQHSASIQLNENIPWNPQIVRAFFGEEIIDENGRRMRSVHLSNGERTCIRVSRDAKINVSNANIIINGKRIQNSSDCNQQ